MKQSMIKQLIDDLVSDNIKLSQAFIKAKIVNKKIKNDEFEKWLSKELEGYEYKDPHLPECRNIWSLINLSAEFPFGRTDTFQVLMPEDTDEDILDMINHHKAIEPISMIEKQIENLGDKTKGYIKIGPQEIEMLAGLYKEQVDGHGGVIRRGNREIGKVQYQNILELTKQQLLENLMELEDQLGLVMQKNDDMTQSEKLDRVFAYLNNDEPLPERPSDIRDNLGFEISEKDLHLILEKLTKAEHVIKKVNKNNIRYYHMSFDGQQIAQTHESYSAYLKTKDSNLTKEVATIIHIGDNIQTSSMRDIKPTNNPQSTVVKQEPNTILAFLSSTTSKIVATVIGGALLWLLIQFVLIPLFS